MRRAVGCVLVDADKRILSTGYNGVARGVEHCIEHPCGGATFKSGEGLDKCEAIHAEINALIQCADVRRVEVAYVTCSPCISCLKALLSSNCARIVAAERYAQTYDQAHEMWTSAGRTMEILGGNAKDGPSPGYRKKVAAMIKTMCTHPGYGTGDHCSDCGKIVERTIR